MAVIRGKQNVYGLWANNKEMTSEGSMDASKRFSRLRFGAFLPRAKQAEGGLRAGKKRPVYWERPGFRGFHPIAINLRVKQPIKAI